jgi:hypothetical protein
VSVEITDGIAAQNWRIEMEGFMTHSLLQLRLIVLVVTMLMLAAMNLLPHRVQGAQSQLAWQQEWEKTLEAAKKEGQVTVYISGYEAVLAEFEKEYPEIKVISVSGRAATNTWPMFSTPAA